MSDERGKAAEQPFWAPPSAETIAQIMQAGMAPPVTSVTVIHVALSAPEVSVILGRSRQLIDRNTNAPIAGAIVEWFQSLSFSPITAKQISLSLAQAIVVYEGTYGPIPEDPNFKLAPIPDLPRKPG